MMNIKGLAGLLFVITLLPAGLAAAETFTHCYGLSFWVFLQDLSQLKAAYPKWQSFLANSAKTFYGTDDYDTAKYISDTLGKSTVEFETLNAGRAGFPVGWLPEPWPFVGFKPAVCRAGITHAG